MFNHYRADSKFAPNQWNKALLCRALPLGHRQVHWELSLWLENVRYRPLKYQWTKMRMPHRCFKLNKTWPCDVTTRVAMIAPSSTSCRCLFAGIFAILEYLHWKNTDVLMIHWEPKVFMRQVLSSPMALGVDVITTSNVVNYDKVGIKATLGFQCTHCSVFYPGCAIFINIMSYK